MVQIRPFIIENFHPMRPFDSRASCQKCLVGGLHLLALLTWSSSYVAWSRTALVYNWMRLIEGLKLAPRKLLLSVAGVGARVSHHKLVCCDYCEKQERINFRDRCSNWSFVNDFTLQFFLSSQEGECNKVFIAIINYTAL